MKRILIIIFGLFGVAQGQTIGYLRYDTVKIYTTKVGGRGSLDVTGNVKFTGLLPKSAGTDSVLVRDASGNLGTTAKSDFGGTPTWQQTLTAGSTLTGNNTIAGGGFDLLFTNNSQFYGQSLVGTKNHYLNLYSSSAVLGGADIVTTNSSAVGVFSDSVKIYPHLGNMFIDTLNYQSNANDSMMVWRPTTGKVGIRAIPTGGGISGLTTNYVTKATSSTTIGNSLIFDDGTNVGIGVGSPVVNLELPNNSTNSSLKVGALEVQSFSVNNNWFADNIRYTGPVNGFEYRATGLGTLAYFSGGNFTIYTAPSGTINTSATLAPRFTVNNTGGVSLNHLTATEASALSSPADGTLIYVSSTNGTFTSIGFWAKENGVWIKL